MGLPTITREKGRLVGKYFFFFLKEGQWIPKYEKEPQHDKTQQNDLCTKQRLISGWASASSDQSLHCPRDLSYQRADS